MGYRPMETRKCQVGDILTTIKGDQWEATTEFSMSRGMGIKHKTNKSRMTIFQDELSMAWVKVERPTPDGLVQVWPEVKE